MVAVTLVIVPPETGQESIFVSLAHDLSSILR